MRLQVHVFYKMPDQHEYTQFDPSRPVGHLDTVFKQAPITDRAEFDREVCEAVWKVLNDISAGVDWDARLRPLWREYDWRTRSIQLGDLIGVWIVEREDDCGEQRWHEITELAFERTDLYTLTLG